MIKEMLLMLILANPNDIIDPVKPDPEVVAVVHQADEADSDLVELLEARKANGKELVVLVTMDGCQPCRTLKGRLAAGNLKKSLDKYNFGIINRGVPAIQPYLEKGAGFPQLFKIYVDKSTGKDYVTRVVGNVEDKKLLDVIERQ